MVQPRIFISSSTAGQRVARALQHQLEPFALVTTWADEANLTNSPASLLEIASRTDFAVFVLSPNDRQSPGQHSQNVRANVLFELGVMIGRLGTSRVLTVAVDADRVPFPSDFAGTMFIPIPFGSDDPSSPAILSAADLIRKEVERQLPTPVLQTGESYSCFISYSNRDRPFAHRLHEDLDMVGVRSWLDAKDIAIGTSWKLEIGKAIQEHDKILLVLSEASISSTWVKREVDSALKRARDGHHNRLPHPA